MLVSSSEGTLAPDMAPRPNSKRTWIWRVITLVLLGLGVYLLLPQIRALPHLAEVIASLSLPALGTAVAAQCLAQAGTGYLLTGVTRSPNSRLSLRRAVAISLASGSVGMVAGGIVGYSAAMARWLRPAGVQTADAVMAGPMVVQVNNLIMMAVAVFGLVHLLMRGALSGVQAAGFALVLMGVLLALAAMLLGQRYPQQVASVLARAATPVVRVVRHVVRRRAEPVLDTRARLVARIAGAMSYWDRRMEHGWARPLLGAGAYLLCDMLTLAALFVATGYPIGAGTLLVGYGLPLLLARVTILPGGIGVVELSMTALYASLGVPQDTLVVVVMVYRFLAFWLPAMIGFVLAPFLQRTVTAGGEPA